MKKQYIHLKDYLPKQFDGNSFFRYDLMVRYLFIEKFYDSGETAEFRYKLYSRFYKHRKIEERSEKFIKIIKSFEKNGFLEDREPYIVMSKKYKMCGGNHRTACCLWFGIHTIPVYIPDDFYDVCKRKKRRWDKQWLISHGLKKYFNLLEDTREVIFKKIGI